MVGEIRDDIRQGVSVIGKPVEEVVREFHQIKSNKIRGFDEGKKNSWYVAIQAVKRIILDRFIN